MGQEQVESKRKRMLATLACKSAVKAGESLAFEKMDYLVEELFKTSNTALCPHGRPIWIRWTVKDLEKLFQRIV